MKWLRKRLMINKSFGFQTKLVFHSEGIFLSKNSMFGRQHRWNNLKMKVNQAKQRLGPRIQAEASSVTQVLRLLSGSFVVSWKTIWMKLPTVFWKIVDHAKGL